MMEWADPWFIAYIHDDARDKHYMTTWKHPTLMLRDLVADDLLCYPTTLCIGVDSDGCFASNDDIKTVIDENSHDDALEENGYSEVKRAIGSLVKACPYLDSEGRIASSILNGGDLGATLGFLLTLLPNLTILKTEDNIDFDSSAFDGLRSIIDNVLKIGYSPGTISHTVSPPLSKLRCLKLQQDLAVGVFAPLFQLPSISSISANNVINNSISSSVMLQCPGFHIEVSKPLRLGFSDLDVSFSDFKVRSYRLSLSEYTPSSKSIIVTTS